MIVRSCRYKLSGSRTNQIELHFSSSIRVCWGWFEALTKTLVESHEQAKIQQVDNTLSFEQRPERGLHSKADLLAYADLNLVACLKIDTRESRSQTTLSFIIS
jgi:hypothetical protein